MKRKSVMIVFTIASVVCFAASALADWQPADGHKMHFPQTPKFSGWDVEFAMSSLADDWMCSQTGPVEDIHFWISWYQDFVQPIGSFTVRIWSDQPVGPGGYSQPNVQLWERTFQAADFTVAEQPPDLQGWYDPSSGVWELANHIRWFQINIEDIQAPFIQEEGTVYWLEIDFGPLPFIGWKETDQHWNDDGVLWYDPDWLELTDPIEGTSIDLAFVITGSPPPVPSVSPVGVAMLGGLVFGIAVAGLVVQRRRT